MFLISWWYYSRGVLARCISVFCVVRDDNIYKSRSFHINTTLNVQFEITEKCLIRPACSQVSRSVRNILHPKTWSLFVWISKCTSKIMGGDY